jgi:hypothetical protein
MVQKILLARFDPLPPSTGLARVKDDLDGVSVSIAGPVGKQWQSLLGCRSSMGGHLLLAQTLRPPLIFKWRLFLRLSSPLAKLFFALSNNSDWSELSKFTSLIQIMEHVERESQLNQPLFYWLLFLVLLFLLLKRLKLYASVP